MLKSMSERAPRPDWVRRLNVMARSVGSASHLISLDPDELVGIAREVTGLSDFGDFDGDWRGRLVLRLSVISAQTGEKETKRLSDTIRAAWLDLTAD